MWLRRLVGVAMIISFIGMNIIVVVGLLQPAPPKRVTAELTDQTLSNATVPTLEITAAQGSISANTPTGISWTSTGDPSSCEATGDWSGAKTPVGSESTGRLKEVRDYTFIMTCANDAGSVEASVTISVQPASAPLSTTNSPAKSTSKTTQTAPKACLGRLPCYGPSDLSSHNTAGNCWGFNGDRVIDISGFDSGFHKSKSGVGSIEISGVCGGNLATALGGGLTAGGQTRDHNTSTKSNGDQNLISYFVGYYDASK